MPIQDGSSRMYANLLLLSSLLAGCSNLPFMAHPTKDTSPEGRVREAEKELHSHPEETSYKSELLRQREQAVLELLAAADKAHDAGNWEEAVLLYQRVLGLDDKNQNAQSKLAAIDAERRYTRLVADAKEMFDQGNFEGAKNKLHLVLLEAPAYAQALELQARIRAKTGQRVEAPQLKSQPNKPVTLEFREANLKMVFEGLSRTSGVNFVLDKDIRPDAKTTVFVKNATLDAAINAILNTNQLEKKILDESTVLIYPNTAQKNNEYRDLVIKSFYLTNADVKQTAALLRTTLKVKNLHLDERLNLLVLRDTPEVVRLAEKLVALQDVAEPEVMLDVEVLEVKTDKFTDIGITYPTNFTAGALSSPGTFSALTLDALRQLNGSGITVSPNPAINIQKTDGIVNLLANPRIRVKSREKAKVQIGDRVPIVTANISTTAATVSDSVQYLDVGLKLEVEPVVSLDDHVAIKVALEVSTIGTQTTTKNGSVVYQIGTRNASTLLRLKDGETQVLAGLINNEDRHNASKIPGLGDIPLLGRLFSDQSDNHTKTEIVLSITPHVINNLQRPGAETMEMWSGTETSISDIIPGNNKGAPAAVSVGISHATPESDRAEQAQATQPEAQPAMLSDQPPPAVPDPVPPMVPEPVPSPPSDH
jgi:general secretion pathway protein D